MSPDFWLNLQLRWDLYHAQQKEADVLEKIKPLMKEQQAIARAHLTNIGYPPPGEIVTASHGKEIYAYNPDGNCLNVIYKYDRSLLPFNLCADAFKCCQTDCSRNIFVTS